MVDYSLLYILLPGAIFLHVTEEFLFPGGFIEWYKELRPPKAGSGIKTGYLVWINTLMIGLCVLPFYYGNSAQGLSYWYLIAAIAAINAYFHIYGVFVLKKYSPGVITGVLLYIPLFIYGSWVLLSSESINWSTAIIYLVLAIGYHLWSMFRQGK